MQNRFVKTFFVQLFGYSARGFEAWLVNNPTSDPEAQTNLEATLYKSISTLHKFTAVKSATASFIVLALAILTSGVLVRAQSAGAPSAPVSKSNAVFKDAWFEDDVVQDKENGVRIHVKFTVTNMKNVDSELAIRFYNGDEPLMDSDDSFSNSLGQVVVTRELKPGFETTDYNDLDLFIPYSQLDLEDGEYSLRMDIDLNRENGELIQHLAWKDFPYSQTKKEEVDESGTKVNRIWVDYNVSRGGKKGMLVHVNFEVAGMKGVDALLAIRIRKGGDTYLESASASFSNADGEFEVTYAIKPGYDTAVYEDATVFIPYNEIVITRGTWDLELDADLRYEDGELIRHLDFYEFEFKRQ